MCGNIVYPKFHLKTPIKNCIWRMSRAAKCASLENYMYT